MTPKMTRPLAHLLPHVLLLSTSLAWSATTMDYRISTSGAQEKPPATPATALLTSTIDGPRFRTTARNSGVVEVSDDDGRTTHFGEPESAPANQPLAPEHGHLFSPMVGTIEDEHLVVRDSRAGPVMFGMPTRTYEVDHDYVIRSRVAYLFGRTVRNRAHYTFTVADIDVSAAAVRTALSRGYGHALSKQAAAFTGLPLLIDGTVETPTGVVQLRLEVESLAR